MSFHHLGHFVARCGFTFEATRADYGYDGSIFTFDANGEIENSYMFVQLKATDRIRLSKDGRYARFSIARADVDLWQDEIFPVYLVVYDAQRDKAYWVYLQKYFQKKGIRAQKMRGQSITIELARRLNENAVRSWRDDKIEMLARIGTVDHA
jgi:hypothetical protein